MNKKIQANSVLSFFSIIMLFGWLSFDIQAQTTKNIIITDSRIELISVIGVLSQIENAGFSRYRTGYYEDVMVHFSNVSDHRAVSLYDSLYNAGFNMDAPITFMLYHSPPPQFSPVLAYSSSMIERAGDKAILARFAEALQNFTEESDFEDFYQAHQTYYKVLIDNAHRAIQDRFSYAQLLTDYYGVKKGSYTLIIAPLLKGGGYGPQVITDGKKDTYCILGPQFGANLNENDSMGDLSWFMYVPFHEYSHSYVNPATEANRSILMDYDTLYAALKDTMQGQAYGNWITCINEHLVRANVIRLMSNVLGDQLGIIEQLIIPQEESRGFLYINELVALMKNYENERSCYPDYRSFYPNIIDFFRMKTMETQ